MIAACLIGAPAVAATPTRVTQAVVSGDGTNFDHSKAIGPVNVPAGALVVIKLSTPQVGQIVTEPSDGNTWTVATAAIAGGNTQSFLYCLSAAADASHTVTVAFNSGINEYGLTIEVYSSGTWTVDATNSGTVIGAYTTAASVTPSLNPTGVGVVSVLWGQYTYPLAGNTATISPGTVINHGSDGTTAVMASSEEIFSAGFSGTITCGMNTSPAANTKTDITYYTFKYSP